MSETRPYTLKIHCRRCSTRCKPVRATTVYQHEMDPRRRTQKAVADCHGDRTTVVVLESQIKNRELLWAFEETDAAPASSARGPR